MATATQETAATEYKVADLKLASGGARRSASPSRRCPADVDSQQACGRQALAGVRSPLVHMTIQTAVLIETLVSWARQCAGVLQHLLDAGHAAAAIAATGVPVFA